MNSQVDGLFFVEFPPKTKAKVAINTMNDRIVYNFWTAVTLVSWFTANMPFFDFLYYYFMFGFSKVDYDGLVFDFTRCFYYPTTNPFYISYFFLKF